MPALHFGPHSSPSPPQLPPARLLHFKKSDKKEGRQRLTTAGANHSQGDREGWVGVQLHQLSRHTYNFFKKPNKIFSIKGEIYSIAICLS